MIRTVEQATSLDTFESRRGAVSKWVEMGAVKAIRDLPEPKGGKVPAVVIPPEDLGITEETPLEDIRGILANARLALRSYLRKCEKDLLDLINVTYGPDGVIVTKTTAEQRAANVGKTKDRK